MLNEYKQYLRLEAAAKLTAAYFEFSKNFLDNDIVFYVPPYFKNFLNAKTFKGKKIKKGYEQDKIIIAIIRKNKIHNVFKYNINN